MTQVEKRDWEKDWLGSITKKREIGGNKKRKPEHRERHYVDRIYAPNPREQKIFLTSILATRYVLKKATQWEGSTRQYYLYNDSRRNCEICQYCADVQDLIAEANLSQCEDRDFLGICKDIYNYLYKLRSIKLSAKAQATEYLEDLEKEGNYIAMVDEIEDLIYNLSIEVHLTPTEQKICALWVQNYSIAQTAEAMRYKITYISENGRIYADSPTVRTHREHIKAKIKMLYPQYIGC